MLFEALFNLTGPRPIVAGTGLIALDLVIPNEPLLLPQLWAGGTCGNVLTILSFLGWEAFPIARLRNDSSSSQITRDFRRWGVRLDYLALDSDGSTPVIVHHIHCSPDRGTTHSFSRRCASCGKRLPWYKPVRVSDAVRIAPTLPSIAVFFFDRTSAGALYLARHAAASGALVVFEPSASSNAKQLSQAMKIAHVVKYSYERLSGLEQLCEEKGVPLVIETRGSAGLRFFSRLRSSSGKWEISESLPTRRVVDTAGCGDWCTAGLITVLGGHGVDAFYKSTPDELRYALRFGQFLAAWNCGFEGARGGMYRSDALTPQEFMMRFLAGDQPHLPQTFPEMQSHEHFVEYACASCGESLYVYK